MKWSKFSAQKISFIQRQAKEGTPVEEMCWKAGVSVQTCYRWRKRYNGLMPSEVKQQLDRLQGPDRTSQSLRTAMPALRHDGRDFTAAGGPKLGASQQPP